LRRNRGFSEIAALLYFGIVGAALIACTAPPQGAVGQSPESMIKNAANAHAATSTLATALLKNNRVTVSQSKSFSILLHASSTALDNANEDLLECRSATASTASTSPDPCAVKVTDVIKLASDGIANVRKTLEAKRP
jgi:hypothetical protein